jgi:hypothetical protein
VATGRIGALKRGTPLSGLSRMTFCINHLMTMGDCTEAKSFPINFRYSGVQSANTFPTIMPSKPPKPRFEHRPVKGMRERIESYCAVCKKFVCASDKTRVLRIAEKAHVCSGPGWH